MNTFWIGMNTPSSKNGRQWTGEYFIPSEATIKWRKHTDLQWQIQKEAFLASVWEAGLKPIRVQIIFIRKSKHKYDFINMCQIIQDAMKYHGWITDDDTTQLKPYPGDDEYDKHYPGCFIKVLKTIPII